MAFLQEYGLFLAKAVTIVIAVVACLGAIIGLKRSDADSHDSKLKLTSLNEHYEMLREQLYEELLDKKALKARQKAQKKANKEKEKSEDALPRLFVLDFDGDVEASAVTALREHISALMQVADNKDTVLLRLESGGGFVHAYGLAASQLIRLREKSLNLVIAVDKVAASGGYMMACVANELIAAPFAIIGSVGVIGAVPNFHNLLKKNDINYEQHTAGEHKRSLTVFGENTDADREQFRKELNETHQLFKNHIAQMRPALNVAEIATGETWYGVQAVEKNLIDRVQTSDDYLLSHLDSHQIIQLEEETETTLLERLKNKYLGAVASAQDTPFKARIH